jgi:hypothetical protein
MWRVLPPQPTRIELTCFAELNNNAALRCVRISRRFACTLQRQFAHSN